MPSSWTGRIRAALLSLAGLWPTWIVAALGCVLIWPAPIGAMPLSQDHTVHLARAWMFGQTVATGHLSAWSSYWYFGFPIGELYPVLGDMAVGSVRALSFGTLPWPVCYAFVFTIAYLSQGLALLRIAKAIGLGPVPGIIAAVLTFLDPGVLREGGWSYTVHYGVWLQPVACALVWLAFAEIALVCGIDPANPDTPWQPRRLVLAGLFVALALLAHPIALPILALGSLVFVLHIGLRRKLGRAMLAVGVAVGLGSCLAAWWVFPLLANRHWMANYGTLYNDLVTMVARMISGSWAKHMSPPIGYAILVGLFWCWIKGNRFAKFLATYAVILWLMSTSDFFFRFRLDWLSESFRYLQYQRFIICAKPGLYLAAGSLVVVVARWGLNAWRTEAPSTARTSKLAGALALAGTMLAFIAVGAAMEAKAGKVGNMRTNRVGNDKKFEKDWQNHGAWMKEKWENREEFWRIAYKARRHSHVYADAPVFTTAPAYKIGFTPGEVFVHKLESEQAAVLDRLRVKYVVGTSAPRGTKPIKRFGRMKVVERPLKEQVARMVGDGELEVLEDDPDGRGVTVEVSGATEGSRIEFNISGYPRWQLLHDGKPVEWYEVSPTGPPKFATQEARRAGEFRAGRGNFPPPTEPILLAADAEDGVYELRYRHWLPADVLGFAALGFGVLIGGGLLVRPAASARLLARVEGMLKPWIVYTALAVVMVVILARYGLGMAREWSTASGWLRVGKTDDVTGMENGPLKVERMIGPAVLVKATADEPASMVLPEVHAVESITGWFAVDDNDLRGGRGGLEIVVRGRPSGATDDDWVDLVKAPVRVRGGKQPLTIPLAKLEEADPVDIEVSVRMKSGKTPRMGFDLEL
jgi:hypothetical protein